MADLGIGTYLGFGVESTHGTPVARTIFLKALSAGIQRTYKIRPTEELYQTGADYRNDFVEGDGVAGDFEVYARYEGMGLLLRHIFGASATTGPSGSTYTHSYTLADSLLTGLTIEQKNGDNAKSENFSGCKIARAVFTVEPGKVAKLRCSIIGKTSAGLETATSPTFTSNDFPVLHNHFASAGISWNSTTYKVKRFEVEINNNLMDRPFVGSLTTDEQLRAGFRDVFVRATIERADALRTAWYAETSSDLTLTATRSATATWAWTGYNAKVYSVKDPISGPGIIDQQIEFRCRADASDQAAKLVIENLQTTAVAA